MNVYEKLLKLQTELKAPKGQFNSFGKYNYRSCEDIQEAVKPLLKETKLILITGDELVSVENKVYIKATATLVDCESGDKLFNSAFAREEVDKKGMDASQTTGSASSYARKYALNGLLALDDVKDADDGKEKTSLIKTFESEIKRTGASLQWFLDKSSVKEAKDINSSDLKAYIDAMKPYPDKK